jgi:hypothetical protein
MFRVLFVFKSTCQWHRVLSVIIHLKGLCHEMDILDMDMKDYKLKSVLLYMRRWFFENILIQKF